MSQETFISICNMVTVSTFSVAIFFWCRAFYILLDCFRILKKGK